MIEIKTEVHYLEVERVGYLNEFCVKTGLRLDLGLTGLSKDTTSG